MQRQTALFFPAHLRLSAEDLPCDVRLKRQCGEEWVRAMGSRQQIRAEILHYSGRYAVHCGVEWGNGFNVATVGRCHQGAVLECQYTVSHPHPPRPMLTELVCQHQGSYQDTIQIQIWSSERHERRHRQGVEFPTFQSQGQNSWAEVLTRCDVPDWLVCPIGTCQMGMAGGAMPH